MKNKNGGAKRPKMKLWKKIVIVLLAIPIALASAIAVLYLYMDNAPVLHKGYNEKIETGGEIENKYLQNGMHETSRTTAKAEDPIKKYTIYYPSELETSDRQYPMILVVNGTGFKATKYEPMLEQMASWGFIVVGTQDKGTGTGETSIETLNYMLDENENADSIFFGKIDVENIGITGFSQGGAATIRAITMYEESHYFKAAAPLSPVCERTASQTTDYPYDSADINCPVLLLAGTSGEFETEIVIPLDQMQEMYSKINAPKVMARRVGMTHDDMMYQAGGYVVAWFMWQLQGDETAAQAFIGENPEILNNAMYQDTAVDLELQYPELRKSPEIGSWYRVSGNGMKDSEGGRYRALFKKGSENKVMIYFAGGGVSINEETARDDTYNTVTVWPDAMANITMNMGGLASDVEGSPFENWSFILFPYATGDFHAGTGEFHYADNDGEEKILYHNGYVNYTETMQKIMSLAGIEDADTVLVTGYSAGGWGAALLADDIYTNYFPDAANKNVLVDSSMALYDGWRDVAINVWQTPESISDKISSDNLTMDCFRALREKYGDGIHLLYDSSTRDGDLAKVQNYFQNGIMDVDEAVADVYQQTLRDAIPQFQEIGVSLFLWDGVSWYGDPRNMTAHTIIATPAVWLPFEEQGQSVAGWVVDAINGNLKDYGLELIEKQY